MLFPTDFNFSVVMEQMPGTFLLFSVFRATRTSPGMIKLVRQLLFRDAAFAADWMEGGAGVMLCCSRRLNCSF